MYPTIHWLLQLNQLWLSLVITSLFTAKRSFVDERWELDVSVGTKISFRMQFQIILVEETGSTRFSSSFQGLTHHRQLAKFTVVGMNAPPLRGPYTRLSVSWWPQVTSASTALTRISCLVCHSCDLLAPQLDRALDCFSLMGTYLSLSKTLRKSPQWEGLHVMSIHICLQILCLKCVVWSAIDPYLASWKVMAIAHTEGLLYSPDQ